MNLLDAVLVTLLALAAVNGFRRGGALQLTAYAGLLLGLLAGALVGPPVARLVESPLSQAFVALTVLVAMAGLGDALGWMVGARVWALARRSALGAVDSVFGALVGAVALLLAVWFVGFNLVNGPFPELSRQVRGSAIIRGLDRTLPRPPSVLAGVRQFLNRFGFPEVFADLPPAPARPVEGPTRREVRRAVEAADQSTFRILGTACAAVQEGTGFMAGEGLVVTNAHVVAGVDSPEVQAPDGSSHRAVTVLFEKDLDIAVLRVEGTPAPPLALVPGVRGRGAAGAILGYPGGGPLRSGGAAVRRELTAVGRDIYGHSVVRREVYELQAVVRPGNSGGPFVLPDGSVAGVVFAASTTDQEVGYAIVSSEVVPLVDRAAGRTDPVSTGGCVR